MNSHRSPEALARRASSHPDPIVRALETSLFLADLGEFSPQSVTRRGINHIVVFERSSHQNGTSPPSPTFTNPLLATEFPLEAVQAAFEKKPDIPQAAIIFRSAPTEPTDPLGTTVATKDV